MLTYLVHVGLVGLALAQNAGTTPAEIDALIRQLGDPRLSTRQTATTALWKSGDAAVPALERALESTDLEVVTRARYLIDRIRTGLGPETDPEVARAIEQFRFGDVNAKRQSLEVLLKTGQLDRLRWLIDRESDEGLRKEFNQRLQGDLLRQAAEAIIADDRSGAEVQLEEVQRRGGAVHLAAFLSLTDQAREQLALLVAQAELKHDSPDGELRWHLHRLLGESGEAKAWAEQAQNRAWLQTLAAAQYDWPALANERTRAPPSANADVSTRVRYWAALAVLRRASNNGKASDEAKQRLLDLQESATDAQIGQIAQALVLLGDFAGAQTLLRGRRRVQLAELLMYQGRYREAFDALAIHDPRHKSLEWFRQLDPNDHRVKIHDLSHPFHAGRLAARMLYTLGEKEQALALFAELAKLDGDEVTRKFVLTNVAKAEFDLGITDQAEQHIAAAIELQGYSPVYRALLPRANLTAERWFARLSETRPQEPKTNLVRLVRQVMSSSYRPRLADDAWSQIIDETRGAIPALAEPERAPWWRQLAEACVVRGERSRAIEYLTVAAGAAATNGYPDWLRIGDLHAQASDWKAAAGAYEHAAQANLRDALARYLHGYALSRSGDATAGEQRIRQARLLPFGDAAARHTLAMGLKERGLRTQAEAEFDLETRLSTFQDFNVLLAGQELAQLRGAREPAATVNYWQLMIARIIELGATVERDGLLRLPQNVHRLRVLQRLEEQRFDGLADELARLQAFTPHDGELVLGSLNRLTRADRSTEGDAMFDRGYEALESIVREFPNAALYHNNLAWLAARSARRLDDALRHAQRAVELMPDHAGHLDTLAEVHFQRGARDEAIRLEKRALELDPDSKTFQLQLERFEKGEKGPAYVNPGET